MYEGSLGRLQTRMLEVLREVAASGRTRDWFEGKVPSSDERTEQATSDLVRLGFIESLETHSCEGRNPYVLTERGRAFLDDVVEKIGTWRPGGVMSIHWGRVSEIEFPLISGFR